jgi:putative membrane protein
MDVVPYCGPAPVPEEIWTRWTLDPPLLAALVVVALLCRPTGDHALSRTPWWGVGWLVLVLVTVSPLCALSSALFSARVVHHTLMIAVAAPLLVLGGLRFPYLSGNATMHAGFGLHGLAIWVWHFPAPYAAALSSDAVYWMMQISLLGTAVLFWQAAVDRRTAAGPVFLSLLGTTMHMGLLGALITFAAHPLYAPHFTSTAAWGLTALDDQQLGGLIMWVPAALPYVGAALAVAYARLRQASSESKAPAS